MEPGGRREPLELHRLAQAVCSLDLTESSWTQELPRLPVPDLWLTLSRYLGSLRAVLAPDEEQPEVAAYGSAVKSSFSRQQLEARRRQFRAAEQRAHQFLLNEGPELQRDLREYANRCQNWATEFWIQDMYLSNPAPLPVNSNPFFLFPRQQFSSAHEMLMFATRLIQFSVDFKCRIDRQNLRQDFGSGQGKGRPLCMETYKNFFHSYRMPHEDSDRLLAQSRRSNHIVVASCNQFYVLRLGQEPLPDPCNAEANGPELSAGCIFEQLLRIYRSSRRRASESMRSAGQVNQVQLPQILPVGLFTSENRKTWARLHKKLSHCGPSGENAHSLRQIEDSLFVLCLDSLVSEQDIQQRAASNAGEDQDILDAQQILTGAGSKLFSANRWFDKFLQIIVSSNGVCGINIEHSASEGITVLRFLEEFLLYIKTNPFKGTNLVAAQFAHASQYEESSTESDQEPEVAPIHELTTKLTGSERDGQQRPVEFHMASSLPESLTETSTPGVGISHQADRIKPLRWHLDSQLCQSLNEARIQMDKLVDNFSLHILRFAKFGRAFIKGQRLSPDAFIQMALQLTFFKRHGHLVSTYESASLRQFRLGRVDNIRSNTCEAYHWIQAMIMCAAKGQNQANQSIMQQSDMSGARGRWREAQEPFVRAIEKQVEILRYTITGSGPDNHLLALKQLAKLRYDDELPQLFADPAYKEFLNFRLSTSQLPNESGITVGYGAVTPDGYGCSYHPCENSITFCVSSFHDCPETSSSAFAAALSESLLQMQELCLERTNLQAISQT